MKKHLLNAEVTYLTIFSCNYQYKKVKVNVSHMIARLLKFIVVIGALPFYTFVGTVPMKNGDRFTSTLLERDGRVEQSLDHSHRGWCR